MKRLNKADIKILQLETGNFWPFYNNKKALSASALTKFMKELEYKAIPEFILKAAAERGKAFHQIIQDYFEKKNYPSFVDKIISNENLNQLDSRIHETINFLKKNELEPSNFVGNEQLYYTFYNGVLIATYVDISFENYIVELKTSNVKANDNPLILLIYEIQLCIQYLCTGKEIYLLWSTGKGISLRKFQISPKLLKILDLLIFFLEKNKEYSENMKKIITKKMLEIYQPCKLIFK